MSDYEGSDLGSGRVEPGQTEAILRAVRHRVIAQQVTQEAQNVAIRALDARQSRTEARSDLLSDRISQSEATVTRLDEDMFGVKGRLGDEGKMGELKERMSELKASIDGMRRQQWAILIVLLTALAGAVAIALLIGKP